jgi:hypothetical protein
MNKKFLISIILSLFLGSGAFAQFPLEFAAGSMPFIPNGPTTASQMAELLIDPPGNGTPSGTFVTASLSNQQFTGLNTVSPGSPAGNPVVMFGATDNPNVGQTFARPVATFAPMSVIGSPTNTMFSNDIFGNPVGIDVDTNYAYNLFTSVQHWAGEPGSAGTGGIPATNARVYMADLTLTFSRPLTNPYIHIVAIGARSSDGKGFATEFDLATGGITLEKVVGTASLEVTGNQINNGNPTGVDVNCPNNSAACGTVRLRGDNITSVTFRVYVRGDNEIASRWGDPNYHTGDQWMMGVSVPSQFTLTAASATINGRINNPAGRGLQDVTLTATALSTGQKFYATPDSSGIYRFADLPVSDSYLIQAKSRTYRFEPDSKVVTLNGDLADIDFTAVSASKTRGR